MQRALLAQTDGARRHIFSARTANTEVEVRNNEAYAVVAGQQLGYQWLGKTNVWRVTICRKFGYCGTVERNNCDRLFVKQHKMDATTMDKAKTACSTLHVNAYLQCNCTGTYTHPVLKLERMGQPVADLIS